MLKKAIPEKTMAVKPGQDKQNYPNRGIDYRLTSVQEMIFST